MCVYVYVCVYMYAYVYIYVYTHMHTYIHINPLVGRMRRDVFLVTSFQYNFINSINLPRMHIPIVQINSDPQTKFSARYFFKSKH